MCISWSHIILDIDYLPSFGPSDERSISWLCKPFKSVTSFEHVNNHLTSAAWLVATNIISLVVTQCRNLRIISLDMRGDHNPGPECTETLKAKILKSKTLPELKYVKFHVTKYLKDENNTNPLRQLLEFFCKVSETVDFQFFEEYKRLNLSIEPFPDFCNLEGHILPPEHPTTLKKLILKHQGHMFNSHYDYAKMLPVCFFEKPCLNNVKALDVSISFDVWRHRGFEVRNGLLHLEDWDLLIASGGRTDSALTCFPILSVWLSTTSWMSLLMKPVCGAGGNRVWPVSLQRTWVWNKSGSSQMISWIQSLK